MSRVCVGKGVFDEDPCIVCRIKLPMMLPRQTPCVSVDGISDLNDAYQILVDEANACSGCVGVYRDVVSSVR
jgi:hypothetical protein